jgi:hypothetical protein
MTLGALHRARAGVALTGALNASDVKVNKDKAERRDMDNLFIKPQKNS